jgi:hypothetical protein
VNEFETILTQPLQQRPSIMPIVQAGSQSVVFNTPLKKLPVAYR